PAMPVEPAAVKTASVAEAPVKVKRQRPTPPPVTEAAAETAPLADQHPKLHQRLEATQALLAAPDRGNISIQLFYTDDIRPERMERFLGRAQRLGKLAEIYIVPIKLSGKDGYRVLYGHYADSNTARAAMKNLPQRYKDAFAPTLHMLENSQNPL
ncbi:MAG: SPOR domain-containing protein, partial [Gammaproteobacteria bacterium]|nr:SPOR domain-containing protein [Gammaproteobacteria bacterium]